MFTVEMIGDTALVARLDAMPATVKSVVGAKVLALAEKLRTHITDDKLSGQVLNVGKNTPGHTGGQLRRSIQWTQDFNGDSLFARVFSAGDVKYAAIHEYGGTIPAHDIYPSKADALAFMIDGRQVFAKVVHMPVVNMPERSFMRSSLAEMAADISAGLKAAAIEGVQQAVHGA